MRIIISSAALMAGMSLPGAAQAADLCRAIALRDAPSSSGGYVVPKGDYVHAITQYQIDPDTGQRSFCAHGGSCYPERITVAGKGVMIVLKLVNCVIGERIDDGLYAVNVDRSRNSAYALRRDDVENQLMSMGMCNSCADNAAEHYVTNPTGPCGRLVHSALEGNPTSKTRLTNDPQICRYDYSEQPAKKRR